MPLTPAEMDRFLDTHFGFEARDDVEGVLNTLAPNAVHDVVGWPMGPSHGRAAARSFYEALFADLADGTVAPLRRLHGDGFVVDDAMWSGRAVGRPFGLEGHGRPLRFRLLHVVEFTDGGDIARENVWVDFAAIGQQLAPPPTGAETT